MSWLNTIDAEQIGGYASTGTLCLWCGHRYPDAYFRQSLDVCGPCNNFRMRHYHDLGNFFVRTLDGAQFRVYVPYEPKMTEALINYHLRSLIVHAP